jgi:hypothetical protein
MRRVVWVAGTLILIALSFAAGRMTLGFRTVPEIIATLPNDESQLSRELDARIRERFPVGSSEDKLLAYLVSANFVPDWRRREEPNASMFVWNGLMCTRIAHVHWRADAGGILTDVRAVYESQCL